MHRMNLVARLLVSPASTAAAIQPLSVTLGCQGCQERRPLPYARRVTVPLFSPPYFSTSSIRQFPEPVSTDGPPKTGTQQSKATDGLDTGTRIGRRSFRRPPLDTAKPYTANTYVSVQRAKELYPQLTQAEFEGVKRYKKRHGAENWFLKDELQRKASTKEISKPVEEKFLQRLKRYFGGMFEEKDKLKKNYLSTLRVDRSQGLILFAVGVNLLNSIFKFFAYTVTYSHAIWAEMIHSIADTINQLILFFGVRYSLRNPDSEHPYGWYNMRNVASLLSGFGIFFFGAGLSFYDGIHAMTHPELLETDNISWALLVLVGSLLSEGGTLYCAMQAMRHNARQNGMTFYEYMRSGQDPSTSVILQEDAAAVLGVLICGPCVVLSHYLQSPLPDAVGSVCVGGLLAAVACSIIRTNTHVLLGRSAPEIKKQQYMAFLEEDPVIRYVYDVKATYIEGGKLRYKAEISLDGEQVVAQYIAKLGPDMEKVRKEMSGVASVEDAEELLLLHGENITDMVGEEVDRIEKKTKRRFPEIRHLDLEVD